MNLSEIFIWVYRLSAAEICLILSVGTMALLGAHQRMKDRSWWRMGLAAALIVWFAVSLWGTILGRGGNVFTPPQLIPFHSLREVFSGGNRELLRSNFMNMVLFYPAGVLAALALPEKWTSRRRLLVLCAVFALYSLSIELVQYRFCLGQAEIDDIIHNTLGAVLGHEAVTVEHRFSVKDP